MGVLDARFVNFIRDASADFTDFVLLVLSMSCVES